jgi:hypothetical protein
MMLIKMARNVLYERVQWQELGTVSKREELTMHGEWLAMEHYRIHVMEQWPDGPRKDVGLAAARSALERLLRAASPNESAFTCVICASRRQSVTVIEYPLRFQSTRSFDVAA